MHAAQAAHIFPVHAHWPCIRRRVEPGQPLFKAVNRRNFNRILKSVLGKLKIPDASRYSSRAFRSGLLRNSWNRAPLVSGRLVGLVAPPDFRGYVDMSRDFEIGAQQLFDVDLDSESECD